MRRAAAVALGLLLLAGCRDRESTRLVLDGRARVPDDEGLVTAVSVTRVTLDGRRTYKITRSLQSFSTYTLAAVPLLQRKGQYVQVGRRGDTVIWMAAIGAVIETERPTVFYLGRVRELDAKRRAVFADGTVLRLEPSVQLPPKGTLVQAELDPQRHRVRAVQAKTSTAAP